MKKPKQKWWRAFVRLRNEFWSFLNKVSALRAMNKACDGVADARTSVLLGCRLSNERAAVYNRLLDAERLIRASRAALRGWNNMDDPEEAEDARQLERVKGMEREEERGRSKRRGADHGIS